MDVECCVSAAGWSDERVSGLPEGCETHGPRQRVKAVGCFWCDPRKGQEQATLVMRVRHAGFDGAIRENAEGDLSPRHVRASKRCNVASTLCQRAMSGRLCTRAKDMEGWHGGLPHRCFPGGAKTAQATNVTADSTNHYGDSLPGQILRSSRQRDERSAATLVTGTPQLDTAVFEGEIPTQGSALQPTDRKSVV